MAREAVIVEAVRTPLGKRNGKLKDWHPVDLLGEVLNETDRACQARCLQGRRRHLRVRLADRRAVSQRRAQRLAGRRAARRGSRHDGRPPVRLLPAGGALRRSGSDLRGLRHRDRLRRREHDPGPDGLERLRRQGFPFTDKLMGRYEGGLVPQGISAEIISERWGLTRRAGRRARRSLPHARRQGHRGRCLQERDPPDQGRDRERDGALRHGTRGSAPRTSRRWARCRRRSRRTGS